MLFRSKNLVLRNHTPRTNAEHKFGSWRPKSLFEGESVLRHLPFLILLPQRRWHGKGDESSLLSQTSSRIYKPIDPSFRIRAGFLFHFSSLVPFLHPFFSSLISFYSNLFQLLVKEFDLSCPSPCQAGRDLLGPSPCITGTECQLFFFFVAVHKLHILYSGVHT